MKAAEQLQAAMLALLEGACKVEAAERRESFREIGRETLEMAIRLEARFSEAPSQGSAVLLPALENVKAASRKLL